MTSAPALDGPVTSSPAATPGREFAPGSPERTSVHEAIARIRSGNFEVASVIGGQRIRTDRLQPIVVPHAHQTQLGQVHLASPEHLEQAIAAATDTGRWWSRASWEDRSAPFVRAADMLEFGPWRDRLVATCMLELSKTNHQADGDAGAETVDFIRANLHNAVTLAGVQPSSSYGVTNHVDYRPLEGFVFAVTPFNFVSMNNLALGPALLGNTVVWKPAESASLVAHLTGLLMREAGLPDGVLNIIYGDGPELGEVALAHRDLAAVAFTGSTSTFQHIWRAVGANVSRYRNYPRVVGETGGKDFVLAHQSADVEALAVACIRGAFEYQGQKCAAASRLYVPKSMWPLLHERLVDITRSITVGDPTEAGTYVGAVINERQFTKHRHALHRATNEGRVLVGGSTDSTVGWFVDPTIVEVEDPLSPYMTEELFAPILAAYVYDDRDWEKTLRLVDESTEYGLTGSVFASDERAIAEAEVALRYTAGNFYINDKPSGATVGQQPFGGARASGTNDKAGTVWNSIRFLSPRAVKRNHQPPRAYGYPHLN